MEKEKEINDPTDKEPHWIFVMQAANSEIALLYCLDKIDLLAFLSATITGQLALAGLKEEFVKITLTKIFENYKKIKSRMEKEERDLNK